MIQTKAITSVLHDVSYAEAANYASKQIYHFINNGDYVFLDFSFNVVNQQDLSKVVSIVIVYRKKQDRDNYGTAP